MSDDQTLAERDRAHDAADQLANAIARLFGADVGEHSNINCPWANALEIIDAAAPSAMDMDTARKCWDALEQYMGDECGHVPDYLNEAERSNLANMIYNFANFSDEVEAA